MHCAKTQLPRWSFQRFGSTIASNFAGRNFFENQTWLSCTSGPVSVWSRVTPGISESAVWCYSFLDFFCCSLSLSHIISCSCLHSNHVVQHRQPAARRHTGRDEKSLGCRRPNMKHFHTPVWLMWALGETLCVYVCVCVRVRGACVQCKSECVWVYKTCEVSTLIHPSNE